MISGAEARASLTGLSRLLRFDAHFADWFDRSPAGARRSFLLMLPLLPVTLIRIFTGLSVAPEAHPAMVALSLGAYYLLSWISFPLLLILIGRTLDRETQAIGALSAYNWFGFWLSLLAFAIDLLGFAEPLAGLSGLLMSLLILASLVYEAFLLNTLIGFGWFGAGLLAVVDYLVAQSLYVALLVAPELLSIPPTTP